MAKLSKLSFDGHGINSADPSHSSHGERLFTASDYFKKHDAFVSLGHLLAAAPELQECIYEAILAFSPTGDYSKLNPTRPNEALILRMIQAFDTSRGISPSPIKFSK